MQGFKKRKAEITVYLSLVFILLLTLVGALIESASLQTMKNYRRADMHRAVECVFAEYQKELLEEYKVFAIEGSYGKGDYSEDKVLGRLEYYCGGNIKNEIERIQFLSDENGKVFYDQVLIYMEHKYGLDIWDNQLGSTGYWERQEKKIEDYETEGEESQKQLDHVLAENEIQLPQEGNPISFLEDLKTISIIDLVMPNDNPVSEKSISDENVLSRRERQNGYGDFDRDEKVSGNASKILFGQYILDNFKAAADKEKGNILDYEIEYIIAGKQSDRENLKEVVNKLLLMRLIPNYTYLQTSTQKKAEVKALALTLCAAFAVPAVTEAAAQMILLAWAYGETIMDLKMLLCGHKVPLTKNESSWQLSLSGLMELKDQGKIQDGKDNENGLEYRDYLRILLLLSKKEKVSIQTLDLIEKNLQKIHGLTFFKADQCISKIEVKSICNFRRGITYQFSTYYGYN